MKKIKTKKRRIIGNINRVRERIFANKESYRKTQARLPFPEKIRLLVKLQKIANTIKAKPGKKPSTIWQI